MKAEHYFDFWIGLEDVTKVKPDPEPVLLALERLKMPKEKALMIGDNYHDILAGKNAGIKTAGVAWSIKGEEYLRQFQPDYIFASYFRFTNNREGVVICGELKHTKFKEAPTLYGMYIKPFLFGRL